MRLTKSELPHLPSEFDGIPTFIVGGWTRDWFRDGVRPSDVDLMVCGVSPEEMRERGFQPINAHEGTFAVFLDSLGREVAIAREERSTGDGHRDFDVTPVPASVGKEEALLRDLKRRDFTVNAIAFDEAGRLHDPHGGVKDLDRGIIRAVDERAFVHDPLRILRGARFAARLNADIAPETKELMKEMVGGLEELPGERIRMELTKTFKQASWPRHFFDMLVAVDALDVAFPELAALKGVPAGPPEWHNERDALHHTLLVIGEMQKRRPNDKRALLMAMAHDLGKASTPREEWPSHHGHAKAGLPIIDRMNRRLRFSNSDLRAMKDAAEKHMKLHSVDEMRSATVFDLVESTRFTDELVDLAIADKRGRLPPADEDKMAEVEATLRRRFDAAEEAIRSINGQTLMDRGRDPSKMGGEKFGKHLRDARIAKMKRIEGE